MAKLLSFKSRPRVEEEASVWLSRMDRGLQPEERSELERWIAADQRHSQALTSMAALWDDMELMRELSGLLELPRRSVAPPRRRNWSLVATGVAVPAAIAALAFLSMPRGEVPQTREAAPRAVAVETVETQAAPQSAAVASNAGEARSTYATALGEQRTETLPDGSLVKLNTSTKVALAYGAAERRVEILHGEAHFEVQHDASRPFIVIAGGRRIRAVGTAFNVRMEPDGRLAVTVTEGRILVSATQAGAAGVASEPAAIQRQVAAGEELLADGTRWQVKPLPPETLSSQLAWQRGMLVFDGQPLDEALAEVARYTAVKFLIRDEAISKLRVGGFYKSGDIDGLVRSLETNLHIKAERQADGTIVLSSG